MCPIRQACPIAAGKLARMSSLVGILKMMPKRFIGSGWLRQTNEQGVGQGSNKTLFGARRFSFTNFGFSSYTLYFLLLLLLLLLLFVSVSVSVPISLSVFHTGERRITVHSMMRLRFEKNRHKHIGQDIKQPLHGKGNPNTVILLLLRIDGLVSGVSASKA